MQIEIHSEDERGNIVRLLKPVKFRFREKTFVVHAGFECDGVSVPRPAWPLGRNRARLHLPGSAGGLDPRRSRPDVFVFPDRRRPRCAARTGRLRRRPRLRQEGVERQPQTAGGSVIETVF